jgi:hypothetical protein
MNEKDEIKVGRLGHKAEVGSVIRSFCQHAGFKVYTESLEAIVQDKKNQWLRGTDEEAKIFRYQAQGVDMALGVLKRMILEGDLAATQMKEVVDDSLEPQQ